MADKDYKCACGAQFDSQQEYQKHRESCQA
jgi:DNA-directed RNA polymerase subunit RPC12/RpoP